MCLPVHTSSESCSAAVTAEADILDQNGGRANLIAWNGHRREVPSPCIIGELVVSRAVHTLRRLAGSAVEYAGTANCLRWPHESLEKYRRGIAKDRSRIFSRHPLLCPPSLTNVHRSSENPVCSGKDGLFSHPVRTSRHGEK